jgi:acyl carrier protein
MQGLITAIEDATQSLPGKIRADSALQAMEGWDSLGMVSFISLVAERHGVELAVEDLQECATVTDLLAMLQRKGGAGL